MSGHFALVPSLIDSRTPTQLVSREIEYQIRPFDPGIVELHILQREGIDPDIIITSSSFIDNEFVIGGRHLYALASVEDMAVSLGMQAGLYFRSLMNEDVPDNIILGED